MYGEYTGGRDEYGDKHGYGIMVYENGHRYEGNYVHGIVNGEGFAHFHNGDEYKGTYSNNKKHGNGVYTWANGIKYEGEWKYNKSIGPGVMTHKNGIIEKGQQNPLGLHVIIQWSRDGISAISKRIGLFQFTNKDGTIEYKYYNENGNLNKELTLEYNKKIEKQRLNTIINKLGNEKNLPLGTNEDIGQLLSNIGYTNK